MMIGKILSEVTIHQIELRVLAHIAGDKHMIEAFRNNVDIHTNTAMRVFGIINPEDVTSEMRHKPKASTLDYYIN